MGSTFYFCVLIFTLAILLPERTWGNTEAHKKEGTQSHGIHPSETVHHSASVPAVHNPGGHRIDSVHSPPKHEFQHPSAPHSSPKEEFHHPSSSHVPPKAEFSHPSVPHVPPKVELHHPSAPHLPPKAEFSHPLAPHSPPKAEFSHPSAPYVPPKAEFSHPSAPHSPPKEEFHHPSAPHVPPKEEFHHPSAPHLPPKAEFSHPSAPHSPPKEEFHQPSAPHSPPKEKFHQPSAPHSPPKEEFHQPSAPHSPPKEKFHQPSAPHLPPNQEFHLPSTPYLPPKEEYSHHPAKHTPPKEEYFPPPEIYTPLKEDYSSPIAEEYMPLPVEEYSPPQEEVYIPAPAEEYSPPPAEEYVPPLEEAYSPPLEEEYSPPVEEEYSSPPAKYTTPKEKYRPPPAKYTPPKEKYRPPPAKYTPPKRKYSPPRTKYPSAKGPYFPERDYTYPKSPAYNKKVYRPETPYKKYSKPLGPYRPVYSPSKYASSRPAYKEPYYQSPSKKKSSYPSKSPSPKRTEEYHQKLIEIRELSPFIRNDVDEDKSKVCYTEECVDASLSILRSINHTVHPCDDFYEFSCGRWVEKHPVPATEYSFSQSNILSEESEQVTHKILSSPQYATDFKPVNSAKAFFALCRDGAVREHDGIGHIVWKLGLYGNWPTITEKWDAKDFDLIKAIADSNRFLPSIQQGLRVYSDSSILAVYVKEDMKYPYKQIIYFDQPGFILSRTVYLYPQSFKTRIDAYKALYYKLTTAILKSSDKVVSISDEYIKLDADKVFAFETELAKISTPDAAPDRYDMHRIYNIKLLDEYQSETDAIYTSPNKYHCKIIWVHLLQELSTDSGVTIDGEEKVVVLEQLYISNFIKLCETTDVRTLANYVNFRLATAFARQSNKELYDFLFEFDQVNEGIAERETLDVLCSVTTLNVFGLAVGVKYVEELGFLKKAKPLVKEIAQTTKTMFIERIREIDWMDAPTKKEAILKAQELALNIAYPNFLFNRTRIELEFKGLEIYENQYFQSWAAAYEWLVIKNFRALKTPTDRERNSWFTYPGHERVYFWDQLISLVIPAVFPPFYRLKAPQYVNYGGIGVVIAASIIKGFDDIGAQYDSKGNARNWWSNETFAEFYGKTQCFVEQYSKFKTSAGLVNGALSSASNIADTGGVRLAYESYKKWRKAEYKNKEEKRLPGLEEYSPEQMFFLNYGTTLCQSITLEGLTNLLQTSSQPPTQYRVIGALQNFDTFSEIWGCKAGTFMNAYAEKECVLW